MRINNVSTLNFGYSKKSKAYIDKNIEQVYEPELREALAQCSDLCNSMEDKIKANEKRQEDYCANSEFVDFFVSLKDLLLSYVMLLFDDSQKYLESEYSYYMSSLKKCKSKENNWRASILEKLRFWDINVGKTKQELSEEINDINKKNNMIDEMTREIIDTYKEEIKNMQKEKKSQDSGPVIETLRRTEFSPNGMQDVMGMDDLKKDLEENVIKPINNPEQAKIDLREYGKRMPTGILLYGPPGCGKTYIIEALAAQANTEVYIMNSANTGSKYVNQSAINIKKAFEQIFNVGDNSDKPIFLFMDEIDAITSNRDSEINSEDIKSIATLLKYIEEAKAHNIIVIGATNRYDLIDPAIRRRFDMKRYVGLPEQEQRESLVKYNLSKKEKGQKLIQNERKIKQIAKALDGFSCSSINIISDLAALNALRRERADIDIPDFDYAIKNTDEEKINEATYKKHNKKGGLGFKIEPLATEVIV